MTMEKMPDKIQLIPDRSDPLMPSACYAGFSVADVMLIGLSPIAMTCNEAWKPLLARLADRFGYCWEWVPTEPFYFERGGWMSRMGEAVLTKVVEHAPAR